MNRILFIFFLAFICPLSAGWQIELRKKVQIQKFPSWMLDQIQADLEPFREIGIFEQNILKTIETFPTHGFVVCRIREGRFSWYCHPASESQDMRVPMFVTAMNQLSHVLRLPNVDFLVFIGEAFCEHSYVPVFSWCKHESWSPYTVAIPDYEALSGNDQYLRAVQEGNKRYPWHNKENIAFWRGMPTGGWGFDFMPRLKLVQVSSVYPELINAKFSGLYPGQEQNLEERAILAPHLGKFTSVSDQIKNKYQILADGHVSAFSRGYWQLFSNCVMFKHASPWRQWYYRALRPYEHYVPFSADSSDLAHHVQWAREHDDEVFMITQQANDFAKKNLKLVDSMLYLYLLINEYAKLQKT